MTDDYKILRLVPGEPVHVTAEKFYHSREVLHLSEIAQIGSPPAAVKRPHAIVRHMADELSALSKRPLTSCLDVGCNGGALTKFLASSFPSTLGIDHSPYLIESAAVRYPNISFRVADARDLDIESASYDVVACSGLIHYLPDWQVILRECCRILRPDGFLLLQFGQAIHPAHRIVRACAASLIGRRRWKTTYRQLKYAVEWKNGRLQFRRDYEPIALNAVTDFLSTIQMKPIQLHLPRPFPGLTADQVGIIAQHCEAASSQEVTTCVRCFDRMS